MDPSLWQFLVSCPEQAVLPYPWERCFDVLTEVLFYRNSLTGTMIFDLRPRVNLGRGLYNINTMWDELSNWMSMMNNEVAWSATAANLFSRNINEHDQDTPFLFTTNCCSLSSARAHLTYLLLPHLVTHCPLCGQFL